MELAIKSLRLNSDKTIAMFDRRSNHINVYFKTASGKPVRRETWKYGDGWDILNHIAKINNMTAVDICQNYLTAGIYSNHAAFIWH